MEPHSEFDMRKATFYLVATVFGFIGFSYIFAEVGCFIGIFFEIRKDCPGADKIAEGFTSLLAAALAYAAGQSTPSK